MKLGLKKSQHILKIFFILYFLMFAGLAQAQTASTGGFNCSAYKAQFQLSGQNTVSPGASVVGNYPVYCSASGLAISIIKYAIGIAGTVTIIALIVGGFFYLTSGGNEEQSEKGKKILINSVIGLVVIIMSFAIVTIVSDILTNVGK